MLCMSPSSEVRAGVLKLAQVSALVPALYKPLIAKLFISINER